MEHLTPHPRRPLPPGSVRASDAEREAVVERLRIASVEGRLTFAELTERTAAAYAAVTRGELEKVVEDLPGVGAPGAEPAPSLVSRRFTAVLGDVREHIVGRIEEELNLLSVLGDIVLDLRDAQVPRGEVAIAAVAVLGDIKVVVPDGVQVQMSGYAVLGDRRVSLRRPAAGRAAPVVRVCAHCVLGDIEIVDGEHDAAAGRSVRDW
ncbi:MULTISPECIES: DUF1707 SHOCT-like domain-containing protein [Thermomonospora]|uniref:Uncharacterized protein n=1 Tax=Thermomonospora curvata (strain ATCC 19995 / DSM 43183 / JCM 3096 / KCTC 9072 / NBRC 15933 / NCIMB 10081 / Henssen B9) TaxID=471852 RepID=D1AC91_THECD|nr:MULTISPECIES: DUF1707 domain-containing protein [Thermomonospora]ACY97357.1 protein of unknown function DUF1707 [Thermomonospora curvata DSM 43183]PKK14717.1 MAG: hypothetical protein BUE48_008780 [Thermomonospora sp. CIF 1]